MYVSQKFNPTVYKKLCYYTTIQKDKVLLYQVFYGDVTTSVTR